MAKRSSRTAAMVAVVNTPIDCLDGQRPHDPPGARGPDRETGHRLNHWSAGGRRTAAPRAGEGQVRRLPADAARQADEEFHNAISELLSDWGSTVPDPEVVSVKIVSPARTN